MSNGYYVMKKSFPHDIEVYTAEDERAAEGAVRFFNANCNGDKYYSREITKEEINRMAKQFAMAQ